MTKFNYLYEKKITYQQHILNSGKRCFELGKLCLLVLINGVYPDLCCESYEDYIKKMYTQLFGENKK